MLVHPVLMLCFGMGSGNSGWLLRFGVDLGNFGCGLYDREWIFLGLVVTFVIRNGCW